MGGGWASAAVLHTGEAHGAGVTREGPRVALPQSSPCLGQKTTGSRSVLGRIPVGGAHVARTSFPGPAAAPSRARGPRSGRVCAAVGWTAAQNLPPSEEGRSPVV